MTRFHDLFSVPTPVIAMTHVPPLPGTPLYADRGVDGLVEAVRADLRVLLDGGADVIMFCNEVRSGPTRWKLATTASQ